MCLNWSSSWGGGSDFAGEAKRQLRQDGQERPAARRVARLHGEAQSGIYYIL